MACRRSHLRRDHGVVGADQVAGTGAVVLVQEQLRVVPVPLSVHTQDCLTLVALEVEDCSSRMTICSGAPPSPQWRQQYTPRAIFVV
jgi:hypothetical protein